MECNSHCDMVPVVLVTSMGDYGKSIFDTINFHILPHVLCKPFLKPSDLYLNTEADINFCIITDTQSTISSLTQPYNKLKILNPNAIFIGLSVVDISIETCSSISSYFDSIFIVGDKDIYQIPLLVQAFVKIFDTPQIIGLDYEDFSSILRTNGIAKFAYSHSKPGDDYDHVISDILFQLSDNGFDSIAAKRIMLIISDPNYLITLDDVNCIIQQIRQRVSDSADMIWSLYVDKTLGEEVRFLMVFTGF